MSRGRWTASAYDDPHTGNFVLFGGDYRNHLVLNAVGFSSSTAGSAVFKTEEAWNIDTKMDDGLPGTGKVISNKGNGVQTRCTTAASVNYPADAGATYLLNRDSKDCYLFFLRAF